MMDPHSIPKPIYRAFGLARALGGTLFADAGEHATVEVWVGQKAALIVNQAMPTAPQTPKQPPQQVAQTLVQMLKQAGDNRMKQAASLDMTLPILLPSVNLKTGPDDFHPIEREQILKFNGKGWELFGKGYGR